MQAFYDPKAKMLRVEFGFNEKEKYDGLVAIARDEKSVLFAASWFDKKPVSLFQEGVSPNIEISLHQVSKVPDNILEFMEKNELGRVDRAAEYTTAWMVC